MKTRERRRYVGGYGQKHRPAAVPHVGYLYRLEGVTIDREKRQIIFDRVGEKPVELTDQALAVLMGEEFESGDLYCSHELASGQLCEHPREAGTEFCRFHGMLAGTTSPTTASKEVAETNLETDDESEPDQFEEDEPPLDGPDSRVEDPTPNAPKPSELPQTPPRGGTVDPAKSAGPQSIRFP